MFLSDKQVAARYSITRECVWKWARDLADFPRPVKLSPGCTRWVEADLERFEQAQRHAAAAGAAAEAAA